MFSPTAMVMVTALLMFPQIAETIYSPALTSISAHFSVTAQQTAQTLSVYFIGFAAGVLFWGRVSDTWGRKPALLAGLAVYAVGTLIALVVSGFTLLLAARVITAFGAATGSVVTQTMLRDRFSGPRLAAIFSLIGIALAISPAVGIYVGGLLAWRWEFYGVFIALTILSGLLLAGSLFILPETRSSQHSDVAFWSVLYLMLRDKKIWLAIVLVAAFNVSLFSYYSLAPFIFARLHFDTQTFGFSGVALAAGSIIGSQINRLLFQQGKSQRWILTLACILNLFGSTGVLCFSDSLNFLLPMALVMTSFSMAIPVVLSSALNAYSHCRGTAGALFGFFYYVFIGSGLMLAGWSQWLGLTLMICALLGCIAAWLYLPLLNEKY